MVKKATMITAEVTRSAVPRSGKRLARNCGMVSALPDPLGLFAQARSDQHPVGDRAEEQPDADPRLDQTGLHKARPPRPSSSQPDMSLAPALTPRPKAADCVRPADSLRNRRSISSRHRARWRASGRNRQRARRGWHCSMACGVTSWPVLDHRQAEIRNDHQGDWPPS